MYKGTTLDLRNHNMKRIRPLLVCLITVLGLIGTFQVHANATSSLHATIMKQDKALFKAFNTCDLPTWKRYLAEDIEFYQDNDKVTTSRKELEPSFLDRCNKDNVASLRREIVEASVEVHPIMEFGAVQFGKHHFFVVDQEGAEQLVAKPKFVHLWRHTNGQWQITRVISYGH